jgi:hypothetical protein
MDELWENTETTILGNPKEFPEFYQITMDDLQIVVKMTSFEASKLDSKKYLENSSLRKFVKDYAFELFGEISSELSEPMEAYLMVDSYLQFVINQNEKK